MENVINAILGFLSTTGIGWAQAIIVVIVGVFLINKVAHILKIGLIKATNNRTMSNFVTSILDVVLTFVLILVVFNMVGIGTSGLMELLSACVIAVGLSLKDSVSHLASGLIIVSTKPFKEGDFVNVGGVEGTVKSVRMFNTQVRTSDNKIITVPNSNIVNDNIVNYDALATRRIDIPLNVAYGSDIEKCKSVFKSVIDKTENVLKLPAAEYVVNQYAQSSIEIMVKLWVRKENYWAVKNKLMEDFYVAMQENGIEIPYNIVDVNIKDFNKNVKEVK